VVVGEPVVWTVSQHSTAQDCVRAQHSFGICDIIFRGIRTLRLLVECSDCGSDLLSGEAKATAYFGLASRAYVDGPMSKRDLTALAKDGSP
jgi:hypothetical protein